MLTTPRGGASLKAESTVYSYRYQTYSDALKNSFLPWTIPQWNSLSPSVVNSQTAKEFRALLI